MATAQVLTVAHRVKHGVETIGDQVKGVTGQVAFVTEQVKGVNNKVEDVDNKVNMIAEGTFNTLTQMSPNTRLRLDGKETRALVQQAADNIDEEKRSSFFS